MLATVLIQILYNFLVFPKSNFGIYLFHFRKQIELA